jgi:hypothetical protein
VPTPPTSELAIVVEPLSAPELLSALSLLSLPVVALALSLSVVLGS